MQGAEVPVVSGPAGRRRRRRSRAQPPSAAGCSPAIAFCGRRRRGADLGRVLLAIGTKADRDVELTHRARRPRRADHRAPRRAGPIRDRRHRRAARRLSVGRRRRRQASRAEQAGLQAGRRDLAINGQRVVFSQRRRRSDHEERRRPIEMRDSPRRPGADDHRDAGSGRAISCGSGSASATRRRRSSPARSRPWASAFSATSSSPV